MLALPDQPASPTARFAMRDARTGYNWPQCRYCGIAKDRDCERVQCLACGQYVCHGNSSRCPLCLIGWLPGWWHSSDAKVCGYKACDKPAVANAPRVHRVCADHLHKAKVFDEIARHVTEALDAHPAYQVRWRQHVWKEVA